VLGASDGVTESANEDSDSMDLTADQFFVGALPPSLARAKLETEMQWAITAVDA